MSHMWSFENYTPETHLLVIAELKKENKELKDALESQTALLGSSQMLCLLVKQKLDSQSEEIITLKDELDACKNTIADWYRRRQEQRRASP